MPSLVSRLCVPFMERIVGPMASVCTIRQSVCLAGLSPRFIRCLIRVNVAAATGPGRRFMVGVSPPDVGVDGNGYSDAAGVQWYELLRPLSSPLLPPLFPSLSLLRVPSLA